MAMTASIKTANMPPMMPPAAALACASVIAKIFIFFSLFYYILSIARYRWERKRFDRCGERAIIEKRSVKWKKQKYIIVKN